jgi:hypothetical protein
MCHSRHLIQALIVALLAACSDSPVAPIEALATVTVQGAGGNDVSVNAVRFNVGIHPPTVDPPPLGNSADLFGQNWLDASDKGRTLIASADTEDDFNTFASLLTNGTNDWIVTFVGGGTRGSDGEIVPNGGAAEGKHESNFFASLPTTGVDLAGYSIARIEFTIDSISFVTPGVMGVTDYYLHGNLVVFGRRN